MTYHIAIVEAVLDAPEDFPPGISGVVIDDSHTVLLATNHPKANRRVRKPELDTFAEQFGTVDSHPGQGHVRAEIRGRGGNVRDEYNPQR